MELAKGFLRRVFGRDDDAVLSRRDALAGLGLAGLLLAAPKPGSGAAEARPLDTPAEATASPAPERAVETHVAEESDATDLSSRHYWRRRRRYWRRRWRWRRRYWRHRYWRRRHWRRRYWRRRYWY
jgi:hypothetical protein